MKPRPTPTNLKETVNEALGPFYHPSLSFYADETHEAAGDLPQTAPAASLLQHRPSSHSLPQARRIGFRVAPGFSERVIFRELFPRGLTLLDLRDTGVEQLNISNVAARQELRDLLAALRLPGVAVSV